MHWNYFAVLSMSLTESKCVGNESWRVTDVVWGTLKPCRNLSWMEVDSGLWGKRRWVTKSQWKSHQRSDLPNVSTRALSESLSKQRVEARGVWLCYAKEDERLSKHTFKPWMYRTAGRLRTLKPLELLHVWEHQGREEQVWLRAMVHQPLCRDSHGTRLPEAGDTSAVILEITSASKA